MAEAYVPTSAELAALLRARVVDAYGNQLDDFDTTTTPTKSDVEELIQRAVEVVLLRVGQDIPDVRTIREHAKAVVLLLSAVLVETSYYPEQVEQGQSAAEFYRDLYADALRDLVGEVQHDEPAGALGRLHSVPIYGVDGGGAAEFPIDYWQRDLDDPL